MTDVVLIEFNELSAPLLTRFMDAGHLPNFKRFFGCSTIYRTTAGNDPLEPWVQWPSVHCGIPYAEHRALHLGDGRRIAQKGIGAVLSDHGIRVGIFGVMNSNYARPNGYHVPDFWDSRDFVYPEELLPFYDFVAHHVKESTRELGLGLRASLGFARFMLTHGLSASTTVAVLRQLFSEIANRQLRWRRAVVLDLIQYDVFRNLNKKYAVRFASFFSNSTAHFQHYFWRNMDPRGFVEPSDPDAHASLRNAVLYGYRSMDHLLGRIMRDYPAHRLMICTGLSQEPWFETTKCTYRPTDFAAFLRFARVSAPLEVIPLMAERFRLECRTPSDALETKRALDGLEVRGEQLMCTTTDGSTVHTGCRIIAAEADILNEPVRSGDKAEVFGRLLYRTTAMNSGRHHHEGSLWIRDGEHRIVADPIPLEAIAPTILAHFGVGAPETMRRDLILSGPVGSGS